MEENDPQGGYRWSAVLAGAATMFFMAWFLIAIVLLETNRGVHAWYVAGGLTLVAVALLVPRRTRRAGGGALLGMAIGSILGSGVCAAMVGTGPVIG